MCLFYQEMLRRKNVYIHKVMKAVVNTATLFELFITKKKPINFKGKSVATVYMIVSRRFFFDSIRCIRSLTYFIPEINFIIIDDGTLTNFQKNLYSRLSVGLHIMQTKEEEKINDKLLKFNHCYSFTSYGWSGKKFFYPILHKMTGKCILIDSDVLIYQKPVEIIEWLHSKEQYNLYMNDYLNFSVISKVEAEWIIKKEIDIPQLNSGLLCIDLDHFWKFNSLRSIDVYIKQILVIVKNRLLGDFHYRDDFDFVFPLLEQSLHWLTFSLTNSKPLPDSYLVFPKHKYSNFDINEPKAIHFTGELPPVNKSMYRYLFTSLISYIKNMLINKYNTTQPWFLTSKEFCWRCWHKPKIGNSLFPHHI